MEISSKMCKKKNILDFASQKDEYTLVSKFEFEKKVGKILFSP
jgi:hypothetical protein